MTDISYMVYTYTPDVTTHTDYNIVTEGEAPTPTGTDPVYKNIGDDWAMDAEDNIFGSDGPPMIASGEYFWYDTSETQWKSVVKESSTPSGGGNLNLNSDSAEITPVLTYLPLKQQSSNPVPSGKDGLWVDTSSNLKFTDDSGNIYTVTIVED